MFVTYFIEKPLKDVEQTYVWMCYGALKVGLDVQDLRHAM